MNRPIPQGDSFSVPVTTYQAFKGYGTNVCDEAALVDDPNLLHDRLDLYKYNTVRYHHTSWLTVQGGVWLDRAKNMLDMSQERGRPAVWTLASKGFDKEKIVLGDQAERSRFLSLMDAFFGKVGDHPAIYLLEPLNEELTGGDAWLAYKDWVTKEIRDRGYTGNLLLKNHGDATVEKTLSVAGRHTYVDAARDGDRKDVYWATSWADQHWHWKAMRGELPSIMGEYGDISQSSLRLENALFMALQAKLQNFSAIYSYAFATHPDHLKPGQKPIDRFVDSTDNMRLAAAAVGYYVFTDPSPVKTWRAPEGTFATSYEYETDLVRIEASGHPYNGERKFRCFVSLDGQPLSKSKSMYVLSGGDYTMTDFEVDPWEEFNDSGNAGIRFRVKNPGKLPCLEGPGEDVSFFNENKDLDAWGIDVQTMQKAGQSTITRRDSNLHELEPRDKILQLVEAQI
jgi:hypothetical protein